MTNFQNVTTRLAGLRKYLNQDYQELCDIRHSMDYRMFGSNLKTQIEELNKFNKLGNRVAAKPTSQQKKKSPAAQQYWLNRSRF